MTRILTALNIALVIAMIAGSVLAYPELPARIPTHFDISGRADAWSDRGVTSWFMLPAIAVLVVCLLQFSQSLLLKKPALLNLPNKEEYLALPEEGKRAVLVHVRGMLAMTTTMMLLIFGLIQLSIWRQAHGHATTTLLMFVLIFGVMSTPLMLGVFLPRIQGAIEEQRRRR